MRFFFLLVLVHPQAPIRAEEKEEGDTFFVTPRKGSQEKKERTSSPVDSPVKTPIESPSSDHAMFGQSSSASSNLGNIFVENEERKASEITVRSPDLSEKVVTVTEVRSNLVFDCNVLQYLLSTYDVCKYCMLGNLKIGDRGSKSCFAYYLTLRCDTCGRGEGFGRFLGSLGAGLT